MSKSPLGEFEIVVLLAVLQAAQGAYAASIAEQIRTRTGRRAARGALYVTLERLVDKGYLKSRLGGAAAERGGRARRYYTATAAGLRAARQARETMRAMWEGLDTVLEEA